MIFKVIFLTKLLIKNAKENNKSDERTALSSLSGFACIFCNLLLCVAKFIIGALSASVSITADAVNNLSDCATNVVTITGARLSNKPVDKEHPFGHGRIEYISALIVSLFIFAMSFELGKSSVEKIIHPQEVKFSFWFLAVLILAICVKLWMAFFNHKLFKLTDNLNMKAVRQDSLNDCIATLSTIAAMVLSGCFHIRRIDGIIGLCVSVFILVSGIKMLKDVISPLLGEPPSKELTDKISSIILEDESVIGVHDLVVHSYGAGKKLASADAEVDGGEDIFALHDVIDKAEKKIFDELGIIICIHIDPIERGNTAVFELRKKAKHIIKSYNQNYSFHDFRITENDGASLMSFDLIIPFEEEEKKNSIKNELTEILEANFENTRVEINVEHSYI